MYKVVGVYQSGAQSQVINGSIVNYDNVILYVVTDDVPENLIASFQGSFVKDIKLKRNSTKLVGAKDWYELVGREVDFGLSLTAKGYQINRVFAVGDPIDNTSKEKK